MGRDRTRHLIGPRRWRIVLATSMGAVVVGACVWLVLTDAPAYRFLVRLYVDKHFLKQTLRQWGIWAPVIFVALQALQVGSARAWDAQVLPPSPPSL